MKSIKLNCLTYATDSNATGENISNAEKKENKERKKSEMFVWCLNGKKYLFIYGMHMHMTNASEVLGTNFNELNA